MVNIRKRGKVYQYQFEISYNRNIQKGRYNKKLDKKMKK